MKLPELPFVPRSSQAELEAQQENLRRKLAERDCQIETLQRQVQTLRDQLAEAEAEAQYQAQAAEHFQERLGELQQGERPLEERVARIERLRDDSVMVRLSPREVEWLRLTLQKAYQELKRANRGQDEYDLHAQALWGGHHTGARETRDQLIWAKQLSGELYDCFKAEREADPKVGIPGVIQVWYCPRGCQTWEIDVPFDHCGNCGAPFELDPRNYREALDERAAQQSLAELEREG